MRPDTIERNIKRGLINMTKVYHAAQKHPDYPSARLANILGMSQNTVLKALTAMRYGWKPEGEK